MLFFSNVNTVRFPWICEICITVKPVTLSTLLALFTAASGTLLLIHDGRRYPFPYQALKIPNVLNFKLSIWSINDLSDIELDLVSNRDSDVNKITCRTGIFLNEPSA